MKANDMTESQLFKAAYKMCDQGGSFAFAIGQAYFCADSTNKVRLVDAFADLFERYAHE